MLLPLSSHRFFGKKKVGSCFIFKDDIVHHRKHIQNFRLYDNDEFIGAVMHEDFSCITDFEETSVVQVFDAFLFWDVRTCSTSRRQAKTYLSDSVQILIIPDNFVRGFLGRIRGNYLRSSVSLSSLEGRRWGDPFHPNGISSAKRSVLFKKRKDVRAFPFSTNERKDIGFRSERIFSWVTVEQLLYWTFA